MSFSNVAILQPFVTNICEILKMQYFGNHLQAQILQAQIFRIV